MDLILAALRIRLHNEPAPIFGDGRATLRWVCAACGLFILTVVVSIFLPNPKRSRRSNPTTIVLIVAARLECPTNVFPF